MSNGHIAKPPVLSFCWTHIYYHDLWNKYKIYFNVCFSCDRQSSLTYSGLYQSLDHNIKKKQLDDGGD